MINGNWERQELENMTKDQLISKVELLQRHIERMKADNKTTLSNLELLSKMLDSIKEDI